MGKEFNHFGKLSIPVITITILLLSIFSACPNDIMRDLVEEKVSDPVPRSMEINGGLPGTPGRVITITAEVSKENDVLEMRMKNESGSWSSWIPYEKTPAGHSRKVMA